MPEGLTVSLRPVTEDDLDVFFQQQLDAEASAMAAFPSRDHDAFYSHWHKILAGGEGTERTIEASGDVAGYIVSWFQDGHREVGYWLGKGYWGRGIASTALRRFVAEIPERPLLAWVAEHNVGSIRVLEKAGFVPDGRDGHHLIYKLDA
jgi:RimJ/RimL family protein N-acetyltransferase